MNKCALFIPRPGMASRMIQQGYVDALRFIGWEVYIGDPKTKLCCRQWIEDHGITLIMTNSRYGVRQLPIQVINDNDISVVVDVLPLNPTNTTIDDPYEFAHTDEPDIINEIKNLLVRTRLEPNIWPEYMRGWENNGFNICHTPAAGNLVQALPPTCSILIDVAMVANFGHRQDIMKHLIEPLFKRLDLLDYSYQAFGDDVWEKAGLNCQGPLAWNAAKIAHIYATAKVCPNVHTAKQVNIQACVNERSFMIPLCGGIQVSDNPMISKYLGEHCSVARSTTDFMNRVIGLVEDQTQRSQQIAAGVEHVAHKHTYFNRLATIFRELGLVKFGDEVETKGESAAVRHCWEINARLSAEERGIPYEQQVVGTS